MVELVLQRIGTVDREIIDLAELERRDQRRLGIAHVGARRVGEDLGGQTGEL